jgi:hypothetical protein
MGMTYQIEGSFLRYSSPKLLGRQDASLQIVMQLAGHSYENSFSDF